jgi:hypothetical protein
LYEKLETLDFCGYFNHYRYCFDFFSCDNNGDNDPIYESVIINLPTTKTEVVFDTIFYSSGAQFTATVNGKNSHLQTVTWTIIENVDIGTTITNGILNVASADHGKIISIKATSTGDTSKFDKKTITVVQCLPSDFFHKWSFLGDIDGYEEIPSLYFVLMKDKYIQDFNSNADCDLILKETIINNIENQQNIYPSGYKITLINHHYGTTSNVYLFLTIDKQKLMWLDESFGGNPYYHFWKKD